MVFLFFSVELFVKICANLWQVFNHEFYESHE